MATGISQVGMGVRALSAAIVAAPRSPFGHIQPTAGFSVDRSCRGPVRKRPKHCRMLREALGCSAVMVPTKAQQSYCRRELGSDRPHPLQGTAFQPRLRTPCPQEGIQKGRADRSPRGCHSQEPALTLPVLVDSPSNVASPCFFKARPLGA